MGIGFSSVKRSRALESFSSVKNDESFANVVFLTGEWRPFALPIRVSQVLESQSGVFLCNSDSLAFDDYIPELDPEDHLQPAQIYFVLPVSKLSYRLTGPDMAALAVRASVALQSYNENTRVGKSKARISPVVLTEQMDDDPWRPRSPVQTGRIFGVGAPGSGSSKKLRRYSSKRAKLAVRSFKLGLNTIYEGSIVVFN